MKKQITAILSVLLVAGVTTAPASARKPHRGYKAHHGAYYESYGRMRGWSPFRGNAAMSGNNGNSAYGNNSLGHIQGGNIGGGK